MDITSIDNVYEDDGIANLSGLLMMMNRRHVSQPNDPQDVIVAILPEYASDGRLDRLDVVTVPAFDPGEMSAAQVALKTAAAAVVADLQAQRALAQEPGPIQVIDNG